MPAEITFPAPDPQYVFDRDCLAFRAIAGGRTVMCLVTCELLYSNFGAKDFTEQEMRRAFREHSAQIQAIAKEHIENGWIDEEGRVFLTTRHTRLHVTITDSLTRWPEGLAAAKESRPLLLDIIGPNAEEVNVEWGTFDGPDQPTLVSLSIHDPKLAITNRTTFTPPLPADPDTRRLWFARIWAHILKMRSQRLAIKTG